MRDGTAWRRLAKINGCKGWDRLAEGVLVIELYLHQSHWLKVNLQRLFVKLFAIRWLQRKIGRNLQQKVLGRLNLLCASYESRFWTNHRGSWWIWKCWWYVYSVISMNVLHTINRLYSEITVEKVCEMKKCSNSLYIWYFLFSFAEKLDRTMRLHIQNINKIKEADIALNGLTVIVGLEIETHGKGL